MFVNELAFHQPEKASSMNNKGAAGPGQLVGLAPEGRRGRECCSRRPEGREWNSDPMATMSIEKAVKTEKKETR